jgi:hypothetical protein
MARDALGMSRTTVAALIDDFVRLGILRDTNVERQRYKTYSYEEYLSILRGGADPL